jgi:hypothetical protein
MLPTAVLIARSRAAPPCQLPPAVHITALAPGPASSAPLSTLSAPQAPAAAAATAAAAAAASLMRSSSLSMVGGAGRHPSTPTSAAASVTAAFSAEAVVAAAVAALQPVVDDAPSPADQQLVWPPTSPAAREAFSTWLARRGVIAAAAAPAQPLTQRDASSESATTAPTGPAHSSSSSKIRSIWEDQLRLHRVVAVTSPLGTLRPSFVGMLSNGAIFQVTLSAQSSAVEAVQCDLSLCDRLSSSMHHIVDAAFSADSVFCVSSAGFLSIVRLWAERERAPAPASSVPPMDNTGAPLPTSAHPHLDAASPSTYVSARSTFPSLSSSLAPRVVQVTNVIAALSALPSMADISRDALPALTVDTSLFGDVCVVGCKCRTGSPRDAVLTVWPGRQSPVEESTSNSVSAGGGPSPLYCVEADGFRLTGSLMQVCKSPLHNDRACTVELVSSEDPRMPPAEVRIVWHQFSAHGQWHELCSYRVLPVRTEAGEWTCVERVAWSPDEGVCLCLFQSGHVGFFSAVTQAAQTSTQQATMESGPVTVEWQHGDECAQGGGLYSVLESPDQGRSTRGVLSRWGDEHGQFADNLVVLSQPWCAEWHPSGALVAVAGGDGAVVGLDVCGQTVAWHLGYDRRWARAWPSLPLGRWSFAARGDAMPGTGMRVSPALAAIAWESMQGAGQRYDAFLAVPLGGPTVSVRVELGASLSGGTLSHLALVSQRLHGGDILRACRLASSLVPVDGERCLRCVEAIIEYELRRPLGVVDEAACTEMLCRVARSSSRWGSKWVDNVDRLLRLWIHRLFGYGRLQSAYDCAVFLRDPVDTFAVRLGASGATGITKAPAYMRESHTANHH